MWIKSYKFSKSYNFKQSSSKFKIQDYASCSCSLFFITIQVFMTNNSHSCSRFKIKLFKPFILNRIQVLHISYYIDEWEDYHRYCSTHYVLKSNTNFFYFLFSCLEYLFYSTWKFVGYTYTYITTEIDNKTNEFILIS